ncbi:MAG TPA: hypothetical protein VK595_11145, partial [Vicinamibacterales bacterium]|nr:hypothetical protein [Vicinamibacterales bacterium]
MGNGPIGHPAGSFGVAYNAVQESACISQGFYVELRDRLAAFGYAHEYDWSQSVAAPTDALDFFAEYGWVVVNSGMRNQVAQRIWGRIVDALNVDQPVTSAFGHPGKAAAIQRVWNERQDFYARYMAADDKIAFLADLPWIGPITKWHLAKNFG